jgi:3'(2'), 5'-bisphosphate nucleotidase
MMSGPFQKEIPIVVQAVREAAKLVLEVYSTNFAVDLKKAREPVTLADRRANDLLTARLSAAFPDDGIVAEESVPRDPRALAEMVQKPRLWLVDPMDGTREFIARNGEFAIMVGLAEKGRPVFGVVCTPADGTVWVGVPGAGTWRLGADAEDRCEVSEVADLAEATLVVSRSHRSQVLLDRVDALGTAHQLACGSVGIKCARVASAQADVYVYLHGAGGAKLWDGCAPEALVLGAGGTVTTVHGTPINYATSELELTGGFVATNGLLHAAVLDRLTAG